MPPKSKKTNKVAFLDEVQIREIPRSFDLSGYNYKTPVSSSTGERVLTIDEMTDKVMGKKKIVSPAFLNLKALDMMPLAPLPMPEEEYNRLKKVRARRKIIEQQRSGLGGSLPPMRLDLAPLPPSTAATKPVASRKKEESVEYTPVEKFKKGGKVKKTGLALVHKGEVVVPAKRVASVDKALKKAGMKPLKK